MSSFGDREMSESTTSRIANVLKQKLTSEELSSRPGPGGAKLTYVPHWRITDLANDVFRFDGWSCYVENIGIDYQQHEAGRWNVGIFAIVRVQLENGASHSDVGWGQSDNVKSRGKAIEKARKQAVSDARKRALRVFGPRLGNSIYDKDHIQDLAAKEADQNRKRPAINQYPGTAISMKHAPYNNGGHASSFNLPPNGPKRSCLPNPSSNSHGANGRVPGTNAAVKPPPPHPTTPGMKSVAKVPGSGSMAVGNGQGGNPAKPSAGGAPNHNNAMPNHNNATLNRNNAMPNHNNALPDTNPVSARRNPPSAHSHPAPPQQGQPLTSSPIMAHQRNPSTTPSLETKPTIPRTPNTHPLKNGASTAGSVPPTHGSHGAQRGSTNAARMPTTTAPMAPTATTSMASTTQQLHTNSTQPQTNTVIPSTQLSATPPSAPTTSDQVPVPNTPVSAGTPRSNPASTPFRARTGTNNNNQPSSNVRLPSAQQHRQHANGASITPQNRPPTGSQQHPTPKPSPQAIPHSEPPSVHQKENAHPAPATKQLPPLTSSQEDAQWEQELLKYAM